MPPRIEEPRFFITGVLLAVSWIGTLYLCRQNQILRQQRTRNSDNGDPVDSADPDADMKQDEPENSFVMDRIGIIQSPFPQRAGCPRQGTLAPYVTSRLMLHPNISIQVLDGIKAYSHVWIIFCFHLNPRKKARSAHGSQQTPKFTANKVRPPRAKGIKVGVMATRAPHRPNPVGLSLALLEDVMVIQNSHGQKQTCVILRGLDLVDGTPVYDIKPYVPSDRISVSQLKVPSWVSADDELAQVNWTPSAREQISKAKEYLAPLYAPTDTGVEEACLAIGEVIAQDPRAMLDGRGECSEDSFEFTFGAFRVCFLVDTRIKQAEVTSVVVDSGDLAASKGSYPHNLALRHLAEQEAKETGKKLKWANPVREGITQGLFDLQSGGTYEPRQDSYE
jgi:tRNA-Thr(GGU) m(6)t(6)A37 methyltransferase TsaA